MSEDLVRAVKRSWIGLALGPGVMKHPYAGSPTRSRFSHAAMAGIWRGLRPSSRGESFHGA